MKKVQFLRPLFRAILEQKKISFSTLDQLIKEYSNNPENGLGFTRKGKKAENASNIRGQLRNPSMNDKNFLRGFEVIKVKKFKIQLTVEYEDGSTGSTTQEFNLKEEQTPEQSLFKPKMPKQD